MTGEGSTYAETELSQAPGEEGTVRIWNIPRGKWGVPLGEYTDPIRKGSIVQFHPMDECCMMVLDDRNTLHILRYGGSALPPAPTIEIGRIEGVLTATFVFGGAKVVTYGLDGHIKTLNTDNLPCPRYLSHHDKKVTVLEAHPLGLLVVSSSDDGTVLLLDVGTGCGVGTLSGNAQGHTGGTHAVAFSADGQLLTCGSEDGFVLI